MSTEERWLAPAPDNFPPLDDIEWWDRFERFADGCQLDHTGLKDDGE